MIQFQKIQPKDKPIYDRYFSDGKERGAEMSFTNLCLWGEQGYAIVEGQFVLLSRFGEYLVYTYPIGDGDKKAALDALMKDADERGISFTLTALYEEEKKNLQALYPDLFLYHDVVNFYDYVYAIDDLADLAGKKYHRKRNHVKRFASQYAYVARPVEESDIPRILDFAKEWFAERQTEENEFDMEIVALSRAMEHRVALGLYGMVLEVGGEIVAFTFANRYSEDTMDVNFEKAKSIDGAYAVINQEFARYIRSVLPEIRFMNREEDMGIAGLRRAKENYFPHHKLVKYRAQKKQSFRKPTAEEVPALRELWKDAFGDEDDYLDVFYSTAFSPERSLALFTDDGAAQAALYWFDCILRGEKIAYIFGVGVATTLRGNGLCREMMSAALSCLKAENYKGVALVPARSELYAMYEKFGFQKFFGVTERLVKAGDTPAVLRRLDADEYVAVRKRYLPDGGVEQAGENAAFLAARTELYAGDDFVFSFVPGIGEFVVELLGNTERAPEIVRALGREELMVRTPGDEKDFAVYQAIDQEVAFPKYFGIPFDF